MTADFELDESRKDAARLLADKAALAARVGNVTRALELLEAAMFIEPTATRIRSWAEASARAGSSAHRDAMKEVASWF